MFKKSFLASFKLEWVFTDVPLAEPNNFSHLQVARLKIKFF